MRDQVEAVQGQAEEVQGPILETVIGKSILIEQLTEKHRSLVHDLLETTQLNPQRGNRHESTIKTMTNGHVMHPPTQQKVVRTEEKAAVGKERVERQVQHRYCPKTA
ncbi:hypothetical protein Y1Q_0023192 [Alligator mississippiensis]|uniref:Uncharacterized protein n=1 Tax=Alligator mississippiensis TaxID=8496 RepID=A0A151MZJ2_ALLMI|nr:hypothetical protein Y1Q_0023192 [Alligator mississippiensis]